MSGGPPGASSGALFAGGGETGRLMAAYDWAASPVGPVENWPASLRFAVRTLLVSRFPMVLSWGPEYTQFYNDGYAPMIGAKHPAIGEDIRITLAEGWDALREPVDTALAGGPSSWLPDLPLLLERAGYREETYFTVSHSSIADDDGRPTGMLGVCTETTGQVISGRRQRLLHELSAAGGADEAEVVASLCAVLARYPLDVPFAAVHLRPVDGGPLRRAGVARCAPEVFPETADGPEGVASQPVAALGLRGGLWQDVVGEVVVLPIVVAGDEVIGTLTVAVSPNRALGEEYRAFHRLLADQTSRAVAGARAYAAERRRAEALAELDAAKTTFFSNVSHELRTPITLLLGPIEDVLTHEAMALAEPVREQLALVARSGRRLQRLVDDLLEVSRIEAGRTVAVRQRIDVARTTTELAALFRAAAERAGLSLTVNCPPLPRPTAVDPGMWEKIVVNLLSNALKYTFVGGITLTLREVDDRLMLAVADTGVGIPADQLPYLFDRFHRVPGAPGRSAEGTGIGLSLVRELTALHGGTVEVASSPGQGSTFTVTLPVGVPDAGTSEDPERVVVASPATLAEATARGQDAVPATADSDVGAGGVLVVDDNADMRAYLVRLLSRSLTVHTAADGQEALAAIRTARPDAVVADVMMPRVDGFELLHAVRADPATRDLPVLLLTARAGQEAAVEGLTAGADDYLAKPFEGSELVARVGALLARASRGGSMPSPAVTIAAADESRGAPSTSNPTAARPAPAPPTPSSPPGPPKAASARAAAPVALDGDGDPQRSSWRVPATPSAVGAVRRQLRGFLLADGLDEDVVYDLLLATGEAVTNAIEHPQDPIEPVVDVSAELGGGWVEIRVRDYGQWRERTASMDRGRGGTMMSALAEVTARRSPEGTTVTIRAAMPPVPARTS